MIALQPDGKLIQRHIAADDEVSKSCLAGVSRKYEEEFVALEGASLRNAEMQEGDFFAEQWLELVQEASPWE